MRHITFFVVIDVLDKGQATCPRCESYKRLEYDLRNRRIYCLECDVTIRNQKGGLQKKFVSRSHVYVESEFAGHEPKTHKIVSKVIWEDIW